MPSPNPTSKTRYQRYKEQLRERFKRGDSHSAREIERAEKFDAAMPGDDARDKTRRDRTFFQLFAAFLNLLKGHRFMLAMALVAGAISTMIGLLPLYGTKLVIDNVLGGKPIEEHLAWLPLPENRRMLLTAIALTMVTLSLISIAFSIWGRWHATRITKRMQISVKRTVFEHAVHLPLHRVYDLKSGGASSLLRDDAGGART